MIGTDDEPSDAEAACRLVAHDKTSWAISQIAKLTPAGRTREVPALGCVLERQPVKLDDWAVAEVRPSVVALPGSNNVVLAYAQSHRHATGGEFDPVTAPSPGRAPKGAGTDSITIERALQPEPMLVWQMNGVPLPRRHGTPR